MSIDHSLTLNLNQWAQSNSGLITMASNDLVYLSILLGGVALLANLVKEISASSFSPALLIQQMKQAVVHIAVPVGLAVVAGEVISTIVARPRPFVDSQAIKAIFTHAADSGMPSSHTVFNIALGFAIFKVHQRWGALILGLALIAGVARVAAGVHYPTDIAAGILLGTLVPYLYFKGLQRFSINNRKI